MSPCPWSDCQSSLPLPLLLQVVCGEGGGERVLASDNYHVCDELAAETAGAVTVWAANGAGRGESRTVSTSTACDSE